METIEKVDSQTDNIINETSPPLASLLLRVRCIQDLIASELMMVFTVPEEIGINEELVCSRIIHCLRDGLGRYVHKPDKIKESLIEMIEILDPEYQCEAIHERGLKNFFFQS